MNFRRVITFFVGAFLLANGGLNPAVAAAPALPLLVRIHWMGLDEISADTNAARLVKIWHLPETAALEKQTLDKLSDWLAGGNTNDAKAKLRPLLNDLVSSEFYLEARAPTNSQPLASGCQLCLALHLSAVRTGLWRTNLATAVEAVTSLHPACTALGWTLAQSQQHKYIEFSHTGEWILIGVGQGTHELLPQFAAGLGIGTSAPVPQASSISNAWLEADFNPAQFGEIAGHSGNVSSGKKITPDLRSTFRPLLSVFNACHLVVSGKDGYAFTQGTLHLAQPCSVNLPAWNIPTNYINLSVNGFTAVRGISAWLSGISAWQETGLQPAPDQLFVWAQSGAPFQTYFAAPLPLASNQLHQLATRLVNQANPWLAAHAQGDFQWQPNLPGLVWNAAFIISPWLKPIILNGQDWSMGGLYPFTTFGESPAPPEMFRPLRTTPNLVFYQTEDTGTQVDANLYITQLFRVVFHKPQLPLNGPAALWLKAIERMLGTDYTEIIRTGPNELSVKRMSTLGFSAWELHLLADWLESPQFPRGLHSFIASPGK